MYRDIPLLLKSFHQSQNRVINTFNKVQKPYFKGILSGNKTYFLVRTKKSKWNLCKYIIVPQMQVYRNNNKAMSKILQSRQDALLQSTDCKYLLRTYCVLYWSFGRKSNMENSDKKEQPVAQNLLSSWSLPDYLCLREKINITESLWHVRHW